MRNSRGAKPGAAARVPARGEGPTGGEGHSVHSGSPILKDFVPAADSLMVERLRKAGAIIIGKTNTPNSGLGRIPTTRSME